MLTSSQFVIGKTVSGADYVSCYGLLNGSPTIPALHIVDGTHLTARPLTANCSQFVRYAADVGALLYPIETLSWPTIVDAFRRENEIV